MSRNPEDDEDLDLFLDDDFIELDAINDIGPEIRNGNTMVPVHFNDEGHLVPSEPVPVVESTRQDNEPERLDISRELFEQWGIGVSSVVPVQDEENNGDDILDFFPDNDPIEGKLSPPPVMIMKIDEIDDLDDKSQETLVRNHASLSRRRRWPVETRNQVERMMHLRSSVMATNAMEWPSTVNLVSDDYSHEKVPHAIDRFLISSIPTGIPVLVKKRGNIVEIREIIEGKIDVLDKNVEEEIDRLLRKLVTEVPADFIVAGFLTICIDEPELVIVDCLNDGFRDISSEPYSYRVGMARNVVIPFHSGPVYMLEFVLPKDVSSIMDEIQSSGDGFVMIDLFHVHGSGSSLISVISPPTKKNVTIDRSSGHDTGEKQEEIPSPDRVDNINSSVFRRPKRGIEEVHIKDP
jgi:hypothetical protein